jgi:hypothetical protein
MEARRCRLRSRDCAPGAEQPGCPPGGTPVLFWGNRTRRQGSSLVEVEDLMKDSDSYGLGLQEGKIPLLATMRREESRCSCGFLPPFLCCPVKGTQTEALYR